jgi:hypothetical protein
MHLTQQYHCRDFYPISLAGCVLYLPFYLYGGNAVKVWDQSGNANHGSVIGAVPSSYPILSNVEKIITGDMSVSGNWTKGTGWAIAGGVATKTAGVASDLEQDVSVVAGKTYQVKFDALTLTAGQFIPRIGGVNGTAVTVAERNIIQIIIAADTTNLKFQSNAAHGGTIDNVSVQEIIAYRGLGWQLKGTNDQIICADSPSLDIGTSDFSVLAWIRPDAEAFDNTGRIASKRDAAFLGYEVYIGSTGLLSAYIGIDGTHYAYGAVATDALIPNVWQCVAVTFDRNVAAYGYINGALESTTLDITPCQSSIANTIDFYIGPYGAVAIQYFKGFIGEELIFNRTLSAIEIYSYYGLTRSRYSV